MEIMLLLLKRMIKKMLLVITLLIAFYVRTVGLNISPPSINFDEAALGYNAYSLMTTGKDEYGVSWPLSFRSFNDYKPALYSYLTIPFIKIFGLNDFSTRLTSAFWGTVSLIWLFFILKNFVKKLDWKFWVVWMAIILEPWRIHFSRVSFESNVSMSFFIMGIFGLLNYKKNKIYKIITLIGFALACYSYHSARLAAPIVVFLVLIDPLKNWSKLINVKFWKKRLFRLWPVLVIIGLMLPLFLDKRANLVLERFQQTNVFQSYFPYAPKELISNKNPWLEWKANPVYYLGGLLTGHVISYLSPHNWSLKIYQWIIKSPQVISSSGMFGIVEGLVIPIGIWLLAKNYKKKKYRFLMYWWLAGLAPAAVTLNWFHPLRSLNMFPVIEIVVIIGLLRILKLRYLNLVITLLLIVQVVFAVNNEWKYSVWDTNGEFQPGGFKEGADLMKVFVNKYDKVYIDSPQAQSYIFFMYYLAYPPQIIQNYAGIRPPVGTDGNLNFNFDKFVFKKFDWPKDRDLNNFVYWTSSEVIDSEIDNTPGARMYKIFNNLNEQKSTIITKE